MSTHTSIPVVVYSDGPSLPTGLARIARDLTARLHAEEAQLGIEVFQVGWNPRPHAQLPWPSWGLSQLHADGDWGAEEIGELWPEMTDGREDGILLSVWDPSRAWSLLPLQSRTRELWGYFPVDGCNVQGTLGGPAGDAVARYTRALAYGRWGSQVLGRIRKPMPFLPHGLDLETWTYETTRETLATVERYLRPRDDHWILGCVATNQPRKDLGLYFGTLAELRRRGHKVLGWLHTDILVRHWSVGQLAEDFGVAKQIRITLANQISDTELAACYACCGVTLAPGKGEGFGYPIVESLACGTPVVHVDYAGGAELVPLQAWRVPYRAEYLDGPYGIRRPVVTPEDAANAVERALGWKRSEERVVQAYCRGAVSHLAWPTLWPRWRSWFKSGLDAYRENL